MPTNTARQQITKQQYHNRCKFINTWSTSGEGENSCGTLVSPSITYEDLRYKIVLDPFFSFLLTFNARNFL